MRPFDFTCEPRFHWKKCGSLYLSFGYLSVILAPFGTVFGYFWLKTSGNPVVNTLANSMLEHFYIHIARTQKICFVRLAYGIAKAWE